MNLLQGSEFHAADSVLETIRHRCIERKSKGKRQIQISLPFPEGRQEKIVATERSRITGK